MDDETKKALSIIGFLLGAILILEMGIAYKLEVFFWQ
jgi:hypothetical protein